MVTIDDLLRELWRGKRLRFEYSATNNKGGMAWRLSDGRRVAIRLIGPMLRKRLVDKKVIEYRHEIILTDEGLISLGLPTQAEMRTVEATVGGEILVFQPGAKRRRNGGGVATNV